MVYHGFPSFTHEYVPAFRDYMTTPIPVPRHRALVTTQPTYPVLAARLSR
jgi:hypothetical protein